MASGWGIHGTKGRCYDLRMDFSNCMSNCTTPCECFPLGDHYFECLHHRKEFARLYAISKEKKRQGLLAATNMSAEKEEH
ncbi:hypothetical protein L7F22_053047 [Adiantum nelumboides]|nr:hypothetical protein [Adiantum nelumboides]